MGTESHDIVIIGGGFYACRLALHLKCALGRRPVILEKGGELLGRASYANQARVHTGYHYPRSILTGLRSSIDMPRFVEQFTDCIHDDFVMYYAIARYGSNVTATQFLTFCRRIGAPAVACPDAVRGLFNPHLIEDVFEVREVAFDAVKLRRRCAEELAAEGIEVRYGAEAVRLSADPDGRINVQVIQRDDTAVLKASHVYNCTYSAMNRILIDSGVSPIPLRHEITELSLVTVPDPLAKIGITVMCGPFFSVMPFPSRGLHSLSHVRYTPHAAWSDTREHASRDPHGRLERFEKRTSYLSIVKDAARYVPIMAECSYQESIWEVKTVLPKNDVDDGRPILMREHEELSGLTCILGSKIDNVYDVLDCVEPPAGVES